MKEMSELRELARKLRKECPWDKEQTLDSMAREIVSEAKELQEAVDPEHIKEEFGDVLMDLLQFSIIAEEQGVFTVEEAIKHVEKKMKRRHPWIYGDAKVKNSKEAVELWNKIKEAEKNG